MNKFINIKNNHVVVAILGLLSLGFSTQLYAQDQSRARGLEEIIVTATKRAESINTVPIAIVAYTADTLEKTGINTSDDLSLVVPGLQMSRAANQATPYLRGVGTSVASAGNEPSVAMYIDDVYNPSPNTSIMSFNNIERIEVLKGPQGTLFGRNATGGLIHVITKQPQQETAIDLSLGYGNYDTLEAKIYATSGVAENLATDLAVYYKKQGKGFVKNTFLGNDTSKDDLSLSVRNKWLYEPSDDTSIELVGNYTKLDSSLGMPIQPRPGTLHSLGGTYSGNWHTVALDQDTETNDESWGISLRVDHSFGEIDFTSLTSYNDIDIHFLVDQEGSPVDLLSIPVDQSQTYWSQELRLSADSERLTWVAGLYYFNNESSYDPLSIAGLAAAPLSSIDVYSTTDLTSTSIFGEMTWHASDKLGVVLGLRWTRDELKQNGHTEFVPLPAEFQPPEYKQDVTYEEPTWRVGLNYQVNDDTMYYATYSRGFKSGGYNSITSGGVGLSPVEPEILDAYELGVKTDIFGGLAHVDAAVFYYLYEDIQVTIITPGGNTNLNAAESTIKGAEFSFTVVPTDNLTISAGLTYLDATYDTFLDGPVYVPLAAGGNASLAGDLSGNDLVHAPELTANLMGLYSIPLDGGGFVDISANYYYNSGYEWDPGGSSPEPSLGLLNAGINWTSADEKYGVKLWGKNLTDEEYALFSYANTFGNVYAAAPSRTYGITFEMSL